MDRVELGIKLDQINKLREKGEYNDAVRVCDTIDWRRVRKWSELSVAQEVYEKAGRLKDSRNICVYAYNRSLGGKRLLFKLTELSIAINDLDEADDLYKEFVESAPRDMERYILLYKLNKARGAGNNKLIDILEEYKQNELDEQYEYELAELYAKAGRVDDCVRECDDLILWFNEGEYVEKALRLKATYAELTKSQRAKLRTMEELHELGAGSEPVRELYEPAPEKNPADLNSAADDTAYSGSGRVYDEEYKVPEKDYSIYDTQNIQAELAKNMAAILEGIKRADSSGKNTFPPEEPLARTAEIIPAERPRDTEDFYGRTAEIYGRGEAPFFAGDEEAQTTPFEDSDDVRVDEPTKEIRINTHNWKVYKSYMVEDEEAETPVSEAEVNEPAVSEGEAAVAEKTEEEEESAAEPEFIAEDTETIAEENVEEISGPEAAAEPEPETEEPAAEESEPEDSVSEESEPETANSEEPETISESEIITETVRTEIPEATEEIADSEIIEGQIDLLSWLDADAQSTEDEEIPVSEKEAEQEAESEPEIISKSEEKEEPEILSKSEDEAEPESETEPQTELKSEPENASEQRAEENPAAESDAGQTANEEELPQIEEPENETDEDKSVEEVMDEMTRMLMEEVTQDIEARERQKKPTGISEEEYIATSETSEAKSGADIEDYEEGYQLAAAADRESAVTKVSDAPKKGKSGGSASQSGFDYVRNDFVLKDEERKYLRQYLFMDGLESQVAQIINSKKRETPDGTSAKGNIVILGKSKTNKKNFAIDLFKAMHANDGAGSLKIARTTAAIINKNGIKASADKVKGMTLIVEHAGQLKKESVAELCEFMKGDTDSMLVMLLGEDYSVKRIFTENPGFGKMFDYTVHIRQYTVNEFVAMAKEYSRIKGYLITDRALLKLYLMIDSLVAKDEGAQVEGVRRIVDRAIARSKKKPKKSGVLIRLKEKDFVD